MENYNFKKIERKWQKRWEREKIFHVAEKKNKKKFYVLEMFPYPSGYLHMGHVFNYTIGDIYARFKRCQGFNVLYPMGYDSFGLPAENAAIKEKSHPKKFTEKSTKNYTKQLKYLGISYDWDRTLETHKPEYYKWNQFFFLKFFEKGLVYKKTAPVNWCRDCNTVLANEQVIGGRCWRHPDCEVEIRHLEQWFLKTTKYSDELLECIDDLKWPVRVKTMQKNWIGKSHGTEIIFRVNGKPWPVFTTRPDTIYGVTFMVISAQHPKLMNLVTDNQRKHVEKFLKKIKSVSEKSFGEIGDLEKEGVFTGSYAVNPINKEKIPVYAGNFVIADYGSGMVMAVPAHDQRDFEFAKKYGIEIRIVIQPKSHDLDSSKMSRAYTEEGNLINSAQFNTLNNKIAIDKITKFLTKKGFGKKTVQYKLRDWLISRQRYWGTPIPVIYCNKCGVVPVPQKALPVKLPEKVKFGKGSPLESVKSWINVKCPKCKSKARRETDTMDTFFDSSWYYLRYCDNKNSKKPFDKKKVDYWMPVDQYIGGAEHAVLHLLYSRLFTKALRDLGFFKKSLKEPFTKLFNQGMLHGEDGHVMSKSRGNGVSPEEVSEKYNIDAARLFLVSIASPDKDIEWSSKGIQGSYKFINKVMKYFEEVKIGKADSKTESKLNQVIKEVTEQIENFKYNLAIINLRNLFETLPNPTSKEILEKSLVLLHPFCPHITEELWEGLGKKRLISLERWPKADLKKINKRFEKQEQMVEKLIGDINNIRKITKKDVSKAYVYVLPKEKQDYFDNLNLIKNKTNLYVEFFSVTDKNKYDPENKSKKVKPGRPGIFLE